MPFSTEHKRKFNDLQAQLRLENRHQLKSKANGGNTILFVVPPEDEDKYLDEALILLEDASFIDINKLLVSYVDRIGMDEFKEFYEAYESNKSEVFKKNKYDERVDLLDMIITEIEKAYLENKIPVLIHTGALFGTGIENVNIMEHPLIMAHKIPLVVFYPATHKNGELYFLNIKPASKYRCNLID
ncbi:MAG: hypothetical protein WCJ95_17385 [Mariniphaga sp.]